MFVTIYVCPKCNWITNSETWCDRENCDGAMTEPLIFSVTKEPGDQR